MKPIFVYTLGMVVVIVAASQLARALGFGQEASLTIISVGPLVYYGLFGRRLEQARTRRE